MTFNWGILLALAIYGLVSLSRRQHHHHRSESQQSQPPAAPSTASAASSWDEVTKLDRYDSKSLKKFITPLVSISSSAYNSSPSSVQGWHYVRSLTPPSEAGAHAVLYQEDSNNKRLVLGFRGTLSKADSCVDRLLFGETSIVPLPSPSWCMSKYSNQSLDYLSQTLDFTRKVVSDFPGAPLLLTGHSLGAALAALVSVTLGSETGRVIPAVGFCAPGGRAVLERRGLKIRDGVEGSVVMIGDEWDLVVKTFWKEQLGVVCVLQYQEPSDCLACLSQTNTSLCSSCLFRSHSMSQITGLLDQGVTTNCTKMFK